MLSRSLLVSLCLAGCVSDRHRLPTSATPVSLTLIDTARQRPVTILMFGKVSTVWPKALAVISHGHGGHAKDHTFIANDLVAKGYVVASVEHEERPGDPPMANSGDLAKLRRPVWRIGADSIRFVIAEMARRGFVDPIPKPIIIGHSNGGDMTMLFAVEHPEAVTAAISLDNRRMRLPRTSRPKVCSLRSSDFEVDRGVLPSWTEQQAMGMLIVDVPVKHDDMWDGGTSGQKKAILKVIADCLDHAAVR